MAVDVAAELDRVVTLLRGNAIRASVDPRDLNPPCVWVAARTLAHDLLGGGGTLRAELYLIAPDTGAGRALRTLTTLLGQVLALVDPDADTSLGEAVTLPGGGQPLPAFRVTVDIETC